MKQFNCMTFYPGKEPRGQCAKCQRSVDKKVYWSTNLPDPHDKRNCPHFEPKTKLQSA
jgi:hypothetical protein